MTHHPKADEIVRFGAGALAQRQAAKVGMHVDGCPRCRKSWERIAAVKRALAAASYPPMPDLVGSEIRLAIAIETAQRQIPRSASWHQFNPERSHGATQSGAGFVQFTHLAWAYHHYEELAARALEYAEDGIAAGQYVELVGLGSMEEPHGPFRQVTRSSTVRRALESGQAGIRDTAGFYQLAGEVVDAEASVARRIAASADARAAGLNGYRVVVDCTDAARTRQQRDAFARYEHLLDRQIIQEPIAAMCAYNVRALGLVAAAELACMHPCANPRAAPFQLYAEHDAAFGLAGTLSDGSVPLFLAALRRLGKPAGSELVIDARSAAYIGRQAVAALSTHAQEMNVTAVLRTSGQLAASIELSYPALTIAGALSHTSDATASDLNAASAAGPGPRASVSLPAPRPASDYPRCAPGKGAGVTCAMYRAFVRAMRSRRRTPNGAAKTLANAPPHRRAAALSVVATMTLAAACSSNVEPDAANVRCEIKSVVKAAGINGQLTPRELRHFVSLMSDSGVPVEEIVRLQATRTHAPQSCFRGTR